MNEKVTDEMLMAYADGELGPEEAGRIAALAEADASLAGRIAGFERSRAAVAHAYRPLIEAPAPAHLVAAALGAANMGRPALPRRVWAGLSALAASLVVVAGMAGYLAGGRQGAPPPSLLAAATAPTAIAVLATTPSGEQVAMEDGGLAFTLTATASYPTESGPCRAFEADGGGNALRGVLCHGAAGWQVPLTVATSGSDGYRTASDPGLAAIDALLDTMGANAALAPELEAQLLARDWQE